jgi:DNA modification methylase
VTIAEVIDGKRKWACAVGDVLDRLREMKTGSARCCVTSPPYFGLRNYAARKTFSTQAEATQWSEESAIEWNEKHGSDRCRYSSGGAAENVQKDGSVRWDGLVGAQSQWSDGTWSSLGNEESPYVFVAHLLEVFREVWRVLADDGTLWLNLGDSYAANRSYQVSPTKWSTLVQGQSSKVPEGLKPKDLIGVPWLAAFALQADGWYLRSDIVWHKPSPMPESVTDRPTRAHEFVFLMSKNDRYFYDDDAIREPHGSVFSQNAIRLAGGVVGGERPEGNNFSKEARRRGGDSSPRTRAERAALLNPSGRNARDVWTIAPEPCSEAHFATMPPELARRCILAGSERDDVILDPFGGAGTTALVSLQNNRRAVMAELNPTYPEIQGRRMAVFDTDAVSPIVAKSSDFGPLFGVRK